MKKTVHGIRDGEKALQILDKKTGERKTRLAYDQYKPQFEAAKPREKVKIRNAMRIHVSKPNKDGSPKTIKQILEELSRAVAIWIADMAQEAQRKAQEIQARTMEAERQRLAAHEGIPSPFEFRPSSTWGRAEEAQTAAPASSLPKP